MTPAASALPFYRWKTSVLGSLPCLSLDPACKKPQLDLHLCSMQLPPQPSGKRGIQLQGNNQHNQRLVARPARTCEQGVGLMKDSVSQKDSDLLMDGVKNQNTGSTNRFPDPQPNDSLCIIQLQLWRRESDWLLLSRWDYLSLDQSASSSDIGSLDWKKRLPQYTFCEGGMDSFGNLSRTVKHLLTYPKLGSSLGRILWQTSDVLEGRLVFQSKGRIL